MRSLQNLTLELSLKPFFRHEEEAIAGIFRDMFRHWYSLIKHARTVSILLWVGDGSEVLEFSGDLAAPLAWGKWLGFACDPYQVSEEDDPAHEALIAYAQLYRDDAPDFLYADLQKIVRILRREAEAALGPGRLRVGIPLDPGPEFVKSHFKYSWHPEILCHSDTSIRQKHIDCTTTLHADQRTYAAYPAGIPEGTALGTFMGRQTKAFAEMLGFDYVWFSNGLGFGRSPYAFGACGQFFDGTSFQPAGNQTVRAAVSRFWTDFCAAAPGMTIETRGTDFTAGMNLVNHAVPYRDLGAPGLPLLSPPNTPWPALTGNYGIALAGYLSHLAVFPGEATFRCYTSDPWWCGSAWNDAFEKSPHDIYMSLAQSRLLADRTVRTPSRYSILTIDTSWGEVPEEFPDEVIPHLKDAARTAPDAPGPLVWLYPLREYESFCFEDTRRMGEVYAGDLLIQQAIAEGLPLNTVLTTDDFLAGGLPVAACPAIVVTPPPVPGSPVEDKLIELLRRGGKVLLYGSLEYASGRLRDLLGITLHAPLEGEFELVNHPATDCYRKNEPAATVFHRAATSAGGVRELCAAPDARVRGLVQMRQAGNERTAAVARVLPAGGAIGWVRGSSSVDPSSGRQLRSCPPEQYFHMEILLRQILGELGLYLAIEREAATNTPCHLLVSRNRNGWYFTGFTPGASALLNVRLPAGTPVCFGMSTEIRSNVAALPLSSFLRKECRIFVESMPDGTLSCHRVGSKLKRVRNRYCLDGLQSARLRIYPVAGLEEQTQILLNTNPHIYTTSEPFRKEWVTDETGSYWRLDDITGSLSLAW